MEASKGISPWGMWQIDALAVVDLGTAGVVGAGGKIHVVVAGAAGRARRLRQPGVGLGRAVIGIVAGLAAQDISRINHRGPIVHGVLKPDNLVWGSGLDAR